MEAYYGEKIVNRFEHDLVLKSVSEGLYIENRGYCFYIRNGWENWILEVPGVNKEGKVVVSLYHENVVDWGNKCRYPGMHLQFTKPCTVSYIVQYIKSHLSKYNKGLHRSSC